MFSGQVNAVCINSLFIPTKIMGMKKMHAQMQRMYRAAREAGQVISDLDQSSLARALNVAQQNVHNWEARGPSKEGLLEAQHRLGINATWVVTGEGPMLIRNASSTQGKSLDGAMAEPWPFKTIPYATFCSLPEEKKRQIETRISDFVEGALPLKSGSPGAA